MFACKGTGCWTVLQVKVTSCTLLLLLATAALPVYARQLRPVAACSLLW
jgi:hypothetical protein